MGGRDATHSKGNGSVKKDARLSALNAISEIYKDYLWKKSAVFESLEKLVNDSSRNPGLASVTFNAEMALVGAGEGTWSRIWNAAFVDISEYFSERLTKKMKELDLRFVAFAKSLPVGKIYHLTYDEKGLRLLEYYSRQFDILNSSALLLVAAELSKVGEAAKLARRDRELNAIEQKAVDKAAKHLNENPYKVDFKKIKRYLREREDDDDEYRPKKEDVEVEFEDPKRSYRHYDV
jgi:hypothetical protein